MVQSLESAAEQCAGFRVGKKCFLKNRLLFLGQEGLVRGSVEVEAPGLVARGATCDPAP